MVSKTKTKSGLFAYITRRDYQSGVCTFKVDGTSKKKEVVVDGKTVVKTVSGKAFLCEGIIPNYPRFTPLIIKGHWNDAKGSLRRFIVEECREGSVYKQNAIDFLVHGGFKGLGESRAEKLVDKIGVDLFSFYENTENAEERIRDAIGKGDTATRLASEITAYIRNRKTEREVLAFVTQYHLGYSTMLSLVRQYGDKAIETVMRNPFSVGVRCNINFLLCDKIWRDTGHGALDVDRIRFLIHEAMLRVESSGSTYCTFDELLVRGRRISREGGCDVVIPDICFLSALLTMSDVDLSLEQNEIRVMRTQLKKREENIVRNVSRLTQKRRSFPFTRDVMDRVEGTLGFSLGEDQINAMSALASAGISVITGEPGAGKTTMVKALVLAYKDMFPQKPVYLAAPTGRAARRMTESTGFMSKTVHKLLNIRPFGEGYTYLGEHDKLPEGLFIFDESTMIDTKLLFMILSSIRENSCVVFIGDPGQLPSVGAGHVLRDMIESGAVPVYALTKIYRQDEDSLIIANARKIRAGNMDVINDAHFRLFTVESNEEACEKLTEILKGVPENQRKDVQVLTTNRDASDGVCVNDINSIVQSLYGFDNLYADFMYGKFCFHLHDRIMFLSNNYKVGYVNGEIGYIDEIIPDSVIKVRVDRRTVTLPFECVSDIIPAYATTIHKSQGSEWSTVITILPDSPRGILTRNLITTGVTRAKQTQYIISINNALSIGAHNTSVNERKTRLKELLVG